MKKKEEDVYDKIAKLMMESKELVTSKDVSNALNIIQGKILQSMLEGELSYHLEYEKNSKEEKNTENRRNGYSSKNKRIRTNNGEITISMPRDRDGSFEPTIIGKRQRVLNDIDDSIICMYAKGMSLSDITDIVKETYKIEVSTSFISTIVKQVTTDLEKWNNRSLKSFYPFLYVDCLYTYVKEELISVKRPVYVIIGIDITGHKEVIGTWLGDSNGEGAYFWRQIFEELNTTKQRIIVLKEQSQKQELIVQRFKEAKERYEKEIRNLQNNLETMKSKNRFSKAVKEYESQFGEFEEFNIDDIQKDIDIEFNASNAQLQEQENKIDLDQLENESNFEEMWGK